MRRLRTENENTYVMLTDSVIRMRDSTPSKLTKNSFPNGVCLRDCVREFCTFGSTNIESLIVYNLTGKLNILANEYVLRKDLSKILSIN